MINRSNLIRVCMLILSGLATTHIHAQNQVLVWADEFNGAGIDESVWQFESGPSNDNVQFYTHRTNNAFIAEGTLRIIALKESYQGYEYTSAHIRTEKALSWRYGRMEASIKLPGSNGFVPAFWMLPVDNMYGWWPVSGEIDIMEHPTNEITTIYGTVHTEYYNLFNGPQPPQGGTVEIGDAEDAFHLYAVEWNPERIDFYVDDQKYYTFLNDPGTSATWPFDQPFYIILNLAVGGGWVGTPDESSVFPAVMEVDYVRVYQDLNDIGIFGPDFITCNTADQGYSTAEIEGATYDWYVPGDAVITAGQGSSSINVDWGLFGGDIEVDIGFDGSSYAKSLPVRVSANLLKNPGFEKGVKYWKSATGFPSKADISLEDGEFYSGLHSIYSNVTTAQGNPWDVQLSQSGLVLNAGTDYLAGVQAKSGTAQTPVNLSVINSSTYALIGQETIFPGDNWGSFEFDFSSPQGMNAAFNVDMGGNTGNYYFDDFMLTTPELLSLNLVTNPDFFDGDDAWNLVLLSGAQAVGTVENGEYAVSISNGGNDPWDVYFGQSGLPVENGYHYMVSFDARADADRQVSFLVGENSVDWTVYSGDNPVNLTTMKTNYSIEFDMNDPTDLQSRLGFDIGGGTGTVRFDNIRLRKGDPISTGTGPPGYANNSFSFGNYPNPVQSYTSFHYNLENAAVVSLRIFSITGQEIETIEQGFRQEGEHRVRWEAAGFSPGVYICRLEAGNRVVNRKFTVIR